jgi:hypothetical protein
MKSNSLSSWPSIFPESALTTYNIKGRQQRKGVIKLLAPPAPPDENTIRKLNALAATPPFCSQHKVKKHDTL